MTKTRIPVAEIRKFRKLFKAYIEYREELREKHGVSYSYLNGLIIGDNGKPSK